MRKNNSYRIIAGTHKGRKIPIYNLNSTLRATSDRAKEALFNWLMNDIQHSNCLDAFSGSGGLAFEACSRGARNVVACERDKKSYVHLNQWAKKVVLPQFKLQHQDFFKFLSQSTQQFNIIFLDPPFSSKNIIDKCLQSIPVVCALNTLVYIENSALIPLEDYPNFKSLKYKKIGNVHLFLLKYISQ